MFKKGNLYLLQDINRRVGGTKRGFLTHENGRVVCGRFSKYEHPLAPDVVFVWDGRQDKADNRRSNYFWAKQFCEQDNPIPVFVRVNTYEWEYKGLYRVDRAAEEEETILRYKKKAGREIRDLVMVLFLEEVDEPGGFI